MTVSERDIEKLKAIGYTVTPESGAWAWEGGTFECNYAGSEDEAWASCKEDAQSPEGLKATMADKVRWLHHELTGSNLMDWTFTFPADQTPEAAVDALFWEVP